MDNARRTLLLVVGTLLAMGMVMVYSASFVVAEKKFGSPTYFLQRHAIYLIAGCLALAVTSLFDYHKLAKYWKWFFGISVVLLIAVLVPGIGSKFNGARRWFSVGGLTFQPSEAVKPLMMLAMAGWIVHSRDRIDSFKHGFLPGVAMAGTAVMLTALEPDLGSAGLLFAVMAAMLYVGGVKLRFALPLVLIGAPLGALVAWKKLKYIQDRVADWWMAISQGISPDPLGSGYQNTQALMAQGSGGLWGSGLGQGHAKLLYLPEAHNDFVFAVIGEELGLVGTLSIVALFALLVITGWRVARRAPDMLGSLIALGVTLCLGLQAAINIAVVTQSMPNKGMPLPFISYGGSALVFAMAAVGLLLNVAAHPPCDAPPDELGATPRKKTSVRVPDLSPAAGE